MRCRVAGAAAALWGSAHLTWGAAATPRFGEALALVALAGFAGAVAVGGWVKRVVGAVVIAAGLLAGGVTLATVIVAMPDRPGALSAAAGVLALHSLEVHAAELGSEDGIALDQFTVSPRFGGL